MQPHLRRSPDKDPCPAVRWEVTLVFAGVWSHQTPRVDWKALASAMAAMGQGRNHKHHQTAEEFFLLYSNWYSLYILYTFLVAIFPIVDWLDKICVGSNDFKSP